MFGKWESITSADILTSFRGIFSSPVAFLGPNSFIIFFISSVIAVGISKFSVFEKLKYLFSIVSELFLKRYFENVLETECRFLPAFILNLRSINYLEGMKEWKDGFYSVVFFIPIWPLTISFTMPHNWNILTLTRNSKIFGR